jgi:FGGY-family pentulose kinase
MNREFVIGVDVGTGSVRAGVFDLRGTMAGYGAREISLWRPRDQYVEQSSADIWNAACSAVRQALEESGVRAAEVAGISFDATCSLVALDANDHPVTVSPTGEDRQNVIVWMDHRAIDEAQRINATRHPLLRYVGGVMSPEMEPPKLLWLKEHLPASWSRAARFLDLADFMTYRATGVDVRSLCTTVCKWAFDGRRGAWDPSFYRKLGMQSLLNEGKIGARVLPMGTPIGPLTETAAGELGISPATMVAVGIIDAHAGGVGVLGMGSKRTPRAQDLERVLALIGGTSSCHMAVSARPRFIRGIWGPYRDAMLPGTWLTEGGQSATGSLLDFVIRTHPASAALAAAAKDRGETVYDALNSLVTDLRQRGKRGPAITQDLHVLPYFLGNRSPHADPTARGIVAGLTMDDSPEGLARLYCATIQAIAYGTRHIIEEMNRHGYRIRRIHACGGGTKNPLWLQEHADITGCEILLPREPEAVLLGTAMLAATGAGLFRSILEASARMSAAGGRYAPDRSTARYHAAKYRVFRSLYTHWNLYRRQMAGVLQP